MELRHLRYFVTTAHLEHFGRAAERLAIVQPALSRQIRELEAELGVALFERLARGVRLTAAGRAFLHDAERLLADAQHAADRARATAAGRAGHLRVGFVDTAIYHPVLPRQIERFRREFPSIELELVQQPSLAQGELLRNGALDIGFVFHRPQNISTLATHPIVSEPIVLAVPHRHPLARRQHVRLAEPRRERFVWIPRAVSPPFYDLVFAACARHGFAPNVVQEGQTDLTILSLVATGVGLSFSVASARRRAPKQVAFVRVSDLGITVQLQAIWRTDNPNPALPPFIAQMQRPASSRSRPSGS
jgi:DNA-binding transcriptional LysR family regulator